MNEIARLYLLPPVVLVVPLALIVLTLLRGMPRHRPVLAALCSLLALVALAATLPVTTKVLVLPLKAGAPHWPAAGRPPAGAVAVPTGGSFEDATGTRRPTRSTVDRAALGAALAARHGLPLAISGGSPEELPYSEAALAVEVLGLDREAVLLDLTARNSRENATAFARLLHPRNIRTVVLVTDAIHMARMAALLRAEGFTVYGNSLGRGFDSPVEWRDFIPSNRGIDYFLQVSAGYGGIAYYLARGYLGLEDLIPG